MEKHFHSSVEAIIIAGVSALIFFNVYRFLAAKAAAQDGVVGEVGKAAGALVHFGG